jgi:hypothetical protein
MKPLVPVSVEDEVLFMVSNSEIYNGYQTLNFVSVF